MSTRSPAASRELVAPFLLISLPLAALLAASTAFVYFTEAAGEKELIAASEAAYVDLIGAALGRDFEHVMADLAYLAEMRELQTYLDSDDPASLETLAENYAAFAMRKGVYDQIRFLDASGMEVVRINRRDGQPLIQEAGKVQNKADRYYVSNTLTLQLGEVFVSPLDLGVENGEIEIPLKPMIRFGTPVADSRGTTRGLVLVNYLAKRLLDNLAGLPVNTGSRMMLLNREGFFLKGRSRSEEWGFMFEGGGDLTFANRFPEAWDAVSQGDSGVVLTEDGHFTFRTVFPLGPGSPYRSRAVQLLQQQYFWKVVTLVPTDTLYNRSRTVARRLLLLDAVILLPLLCIAWLAARLIAIRKRTEQKIREDEERYGTLFRNSNDGIIVFDENGDVADANEKVLEKFGWSAAEMRSITARDLHPEEEIERSLSALRTAVDAGSATFETMFLRSDGATFPAEVSAWSLSVNDRKVVQVIIHDMDEKRKLEAQLREAQKMESVGHLAGGVAHEFNNILTAIVMHADLGRVETDDGESVNERFRDILASSERACQLTTSLLAFSRKQIVDARPVDLKEIIAKVEKLLSRVIGEDIEMRTVTPPDDLTILADPSQVEQILMNMATNARDAMSDGGAFTIEAKRVRLDETFTRVHDFGTPGWYVLLEATDSGCGMNSAIQQSIFDPFFTTKEVGKGTGLGLAVIYGIVKQHKGHISVYSEPGRGTTFKVFLPLHQVEAQRDEPAQHPPVRGGTETVLIAEDERRVREPLRSVLEEHGYTVMEAVDGEAAVACYRDHWARIDFLLLDVVMPVMNGREVYDRARKIRPDIPALFMSGYPSGAIHNRGVLEEGIDFVSKPVMMHDLLRKIREILDRKPAPPVRVTATARRDDGVCQTA